VRTQELLPRGWAATQSNLGVALARLGELEGRSDRLEQAVAAHQKALTEITRERMPLEWAISQSKLGLALWKLGQQEKDSRRLEQAGSAFREALKRNEMRERLPLDWARTQINLGLTLESGGQSKVGTERLQEAAAAYREALNELTQENYPTDWATARTKLADVMGILRERQASTAMTLVERWWKWVLGIQAGLLLFLNTIVLIRARWSAAAWRVATDDSWSTAVLRFPAVILRHWAKAQLWVLDLYVQKQRLALTPASMPYFPVPVAGPRNRQLQSNELITELSAARRVWVQGGSGMGKTALIRSLTEAHFCSGRSSFAVYRKHGFLLVPIAARRFAEAGTEDKRDPGWLIECIRAVLSSNGLTFENEALLRAILHKGTLAVAIDGLNEVARVNSVEAFADTFDNTPILVTSQDEGGDRFKTWHLPALSEYRGALLCAYLGDESGNTVLARLQACGLIDHIESGYDIRLVVDLTREDPKNAPLPKNRLGLYGSVVEAAWPRGAEEQRRMQQAQLQAAAWKLVSEREPYEDKRRLKVDVDLPRQLLTALADATDHFSRSVRLVRGVGQDFEFVHDQMHLYLAACWCTGYERSIAELLEMICTSKIWKDTKEVQRILCEFVVSMLDREVIHAHWVQVFGEERLDSLRRALEREADKQDLELKIPRKQRAKMAV
jgi:tetratricopeptide (TPR) repeat protein